MLWEVRSSFRVPLETGEYPFVRVGEQCQDAALAAVSVGLGGVIFAGLLMAGLIELGIDGFQRTGVVGYAFGCPLDD